MKKLAIITALAVATVAGTAWGQASLRPDPTPRLPPQPGQALPLEDAEFLRAARAVSRHETEIAKTAAKIEHPRLKPLAQEIGERHQALQGELGKLAEARGVDASKPPTTTKPRNAVAVAEKAAQELSKAQGQDLPAAYVDAQLAIHDRLVDLYQTQASSTPDSALSSFAIKTLTQIQQQRDQLRHVAAEFGIAVHERGQPPQYGSAEGGRKGQ